MKNKEIQELQGRWENNKIKDGTMCHCGGKAEAGFSFRTGFSPGPYHISPALYYCRNCISDFIDGLECVRKDLILVRREWVNRDKPEQKDNKEYAKHPNE